MDFNYKLCIDIVKRFAKICANDADAVISVRSWKQLDFKNLTEDQLRIHNFENYELVAILRQIHSYMSNRAFEVINCDIFLKNIRYCIKMIESQPLSREFNLQMKLTKLSEEHVALKMKYDKIIAAFKVDE